MTRAVALGLGVVAAVAGLLAGLLSSPALAVAAGSTSLLAALAAWRAVAEAQPVPSSGTAATGEGEGDVIVDPETIDLSGPAPGRPRRPVRRRVPLARAAGTEAGGLLTEQFLTTTLRGRVAVARRALRPLSVVCFEVLDDTGEGFVVADTDHVADILAATLRESDVAGYLGDDAYLFVLEETSEDGAVWTAERLRRNLTSGSPGRRRFRAGVAAYPAHGLEADDLLTKAVRALDHARDWSRDRIEVATDP